MHVYMCYQVDDYHGCKVRDPYSWLEDPDSEKTQAFVNAQNQLTLPFLEQYFHFYNTGLQNQSVLYMQKNLEAEPSVFLDPNSFSEDGTVALRGYTFSEDGEYLAYGTSASGSDWVEIRFLRVDGAVLLEDRLERVKFTCMSWTHDGKGLFYNSYPEQEGKSDGKHTQTRTMRKFTHAALVFLFIYFFIFITIIYHCDLTKEPLQPHIFREVTVKGFSPADYQTTQVFYPSKDGTQIPMFIVHKKGIKLDGSHPAFLYGYGGFNISITPSYSVSRLIFVRHLGGVLAVANIRGGGEYGETWHKAGMLANKQNCFTDFQCAAEYLIKEGYTSPKKITINGGSNGGLLVAACVNQRPDLFGCAVAQVGVMDMLKFHKFTIGHAWTTDFGCSEIKAQFDWLIKYSPLHNIRVPEADGVQYPAVLLLTGDHDDRVVPLHSLKYMATLQSVIGQWPGQLNPLFIYVDTKSGHGAGKPTSKVIQEVADTYAFIARCLNLSWIE
uniref:Prolyl endopeptidase n=1 Tax=Sinocyclocheilus grahami TaxID=75366 RepID=A0A672TA18_SINGR